MLEKGNDSVIPDDAGKADGITEVRRQETLLKTGALQNAILTSANFSIIATDEKGIIQLFNVGGVRSSWLMLERKSDFARLAFSATAMASFSSNSTCLRTELSVPINKYPMISP